MLTSFHDEELGSELHRLGFEVLEKLSSEEIQRRYYWGRTTGLTMLDHTQFVCARVTFLEEFREVGFRESVILRTIRNARTKDNRVLAAEIYAQR